PALQTPHLLPPLFFYLMTRPPPRSTIFPYTTLFRSLRHRAGKGPGAPGRARGYARKQRQRRGRDGGDEQPGADPSTGHGVPPPEIGRASCRKEGRSRGAGEGENTRVRRETGWRYGTR